MKTFGDHSDKILKVIALNKNVIVSCGLDKSIRVWEWKNGQEFKRLKGHTAGVLCLLKITDNIIISGSEDNSMKFWNVKE